MNTLLIKLSNKRILIFSAILTLILLLSLRIFDSPLHTVQAPSGIVSFELAKNIDTTQSILASWDSIAKINAGLSLGLDFLFLFAYSFFFATTCLLIAENFNKNHLKYKIGILLAYLLLIAGACDAIENIALIKLLLGSNTGIYSSIAYYFASVKFTIIAVGTIYIIVGLAISLFQKRFQT